MTVENNNNNITKTCKISLIGEDVAFKNPIPNSLKIKVAKIVHNEYLKYLERCEINRNRVRL